MRHRPESGSDPESLIIAPQWIGDAVMTEPLLRRLHARGEKLTVGALPWVAPVYRAMPQVSEVIEFPFQHGGLQFKARRSLARQVHGRFDTAYVLPNSLKSSLLPFLAGIPRRIGYLGEPPELPEAWHAFTPDHLNSPNLWTDAYLCAYCHAARLTLVTFDSRIPAREGVEFIRLGGSLEE